MSLTELIHFDKDGEPEKTGWRGLVLEKLFLALVIILVATLGFGVGRLTGGEESEPVRIEYDSTLTTNYPQPTTKNAASAIQALPEGGVVVSKSGSKYHYPYCTGAKQIKEENKISFVSAKEAEAAGYILATNCSPR